MTTKKADKETNLQEEESKNSQFGTGGIDLSRLPTEGYLIGTYSLTALKMSAQEHLDELGELARSYGINVVGSMVCSLKKPHARTYLGEGKIEEMAQEIAKSGATLVIFDHELSPSQQRNLEEVLKVSVADRAEIILGVFAKHAKSKEAKLQVEQALIQHHLPRLKRLWTHLSRQRGGGVYQKGEGEKQLEIDRRLLKKRQEFIKGCIEEIEQTRKSKQSARERSNIPIFAIIGYTNAGKSTLMNKLTDAGVLAEDKLFATLDTTTRKYRLESGTEILMIDTVGFIRKLPHLLIAAFRSTLEEAMQADILIHLVDGSHPQVAEHIQATGEVLKELGADNKEKITVFNKVDKMSSSAVMQLRLQYPGACFVSSTTGEGLDGFLDRLQRMLSARRVRVVLRLPQDRFDIMHQLYEVGHVHSVDYDENDVLVDVELEDRERGRLAGYIISENSSNT